MDDEHSTRSAAPANTVVVATFTDDTMELWSDDTAPPRVVRGPAVVFPTSPVWTPFGVEFLTEHRVYPAAAPEGEPDA